MNVSSDASQPQLPLEFRVPPVKRGDDLFVTRPMLPGGRPTAWEDLTFRARPSGEEGAVFVAGTVDEAFARARRATGFGPTSDPHFQGDTAAVLQAAEGYWILPVGIYSRMEADESRVFNYDESSPAFAPDFTSRHNRFESRVWQKLHPDVVGIALRGKVLDMTKADSYTFDGWHRPPVS